MPGPNDDKDKGKEEIDMTPYKLRTRKTNALFGIEIKRSDIGEYEICVMNCHFALLL